MLVKNKLASKIVIGSANFGQKYGIPKKKLSLKNAKTIISRAIKNNILFIDTAPEYGNSEKLIGKLDRKKKLKVITKIPKLPSNLDKKKIEKWISQRVHLSLKNTGQKRFYGLLIHNSKDLLSPKGKVLFKNMVEIKKKGLAKKIGVSVYKVKDLKKILKRYRIDIVQLPLNIFNKEFSKNSLLKFLKRKKIEIHARSIFLKGLLVSNQFKNIRNNSKLKNSLYYFYNWALNEKIDTKKFCLGYVIRKVDRVILGFNKVSQLNKILNYQSIGTNYKLPNFIIKQKNIDLRNLKI